MSILPPRRRHFVSLISFIPSSGARLCGCCNSEIVDEREFFSVRRRFDTGSLKLSLVCPTTKPNVILFSDRIDFGKRAVHVRHDEWLLVRNVTPCPVPLRVSPTNPIGPFFCAHVIRINIDPGVGTGNERVSKNFVRAVFFFSGYERRAITVARPHRADQSLFHAGTRDAGESTTSFKLYPIASPSRPYPFREEDIFRVRGHVSRGKNVSLSQYFVIIIVTVRRGYGSYEIGRSANLTCYKKIKEIKRAYSSNLFFNESTS